MTERLTVILDVGKTMAKLSLWQTDGQLVARETRPNVRIDTGAYVALDVHGIEAWMAEVLTRFAAFGVIGAIVPVGHGAAAAIIRDGKLVCPPLDYEEPIEEQAQAAYVAGRSPFGETGSPFLPNGLNLGAQLHQLEAIDPLLLEGDALILPWAQYWAWRLSGVAASEVTSLACHTDLWNPWAGAPSSMARRRGWASHLAPLRRASDILGMIAPEWSHRCGLPSDVAIYCGLHDSNAALLAARGFSEIADQEATIVSTGTWFVAMRTPGAQVRIDPGAISEMRDCLINVDADGRLVPSARFMGGREVERLTGRDSAGIDSPSDQSALLAAVPTLLAAGSYIKPGFAPGFGPFPHHRGEWVNKPEDQVTQRAAIALYLALVTDISLDLIGSHDRILVEGRFADADLFVRALAAFRPQDTVYRSHAHNDVSYGALRLTNPALAPASALSKVEPLNADLLSYRAAWRRDVEHVEIAA